MSEKDWTDLPVKDIFVANKKQKGVIVTNKKAKRPVVVTTEQRGVFFGYLKKHTGKVVELERARCAIYWTADVRGFMGLAATGPMKGCRIGPAVDMTLYGVTCILKASDKSVEEWEKGQWS